MSDSALLLTTYQHDTRLQAMLIVVHVKNVQSRGNNTLLNERYGSIIISYLNRLLSRQNIA